MPFPVVVGAGTDVHAAVGLMRKVFGALQQSGGVLVDRDGIVRHAHSATNPGGSYDRQGVQQAISELPGAA